MSSRLEEAVAYAQLGWPVFPVSRESKRPLTTHGHLDASTNVDEVRACWTDVHPDANIGVHLGAAGLCAVDIDPRNGGDEQLEELEQELGPLPRACYASTPSGGCHIIMRLVPGRRPRGKARLRNEGQSGVDFKQNGYVLLAGSTRADGRAYEWLELEPYDVPEVPSTWVDVLYHPDVCDAEAPDAAGDAEKWREPSDSVLYPRDRERLEEHVNKIGNREGGEATTMKVVAAIFHYWGLSVDEGWPVLVEWNQRNPLKEQHSEAALRRQIRRVAAHDLWGGRGHKRELGLGASSTVFHPKILGRTPIGMSDEERKLPQPETRKASDILMLPEAPPAGEVEAPLEMILVANYRAEQKKLVLRKDLASQRDADILKRIANPTATLPSDCGNDSSDRVLNAYASAAVRYALPNAEDAQLVGMLTKFAWPAERAAAAVQRARTESAVPEGGESTPEEAEKNQADQILDLVARFDTLLFHNPNQEVYARVGLRERHAIYPVDSQPFRRWVAWLYYEATKKACSEAGLGAAINTLAGRALHDGPEYEVCVRVGEHDGKTYIDMCDCLGRAIEIDADGWRVIEDELVPVKFVRSPGMLPLPEPIAGGSIASLWKYVLVRESDRLRVLAWLISAARAKGPFYVLVTTGERGSVKSSAQWVLRMLLDPNEAAARMSIGADRDLMISAMKSWVQAYDNLKVLTDDQSNALCGLATGAAFATRTLHTNSDETILKASRPVTLNGIADIVTAGDLLDRAIRIDCPKFEGARRPQEEVRAEFLDEHPALLGALLGLVSRALRELPVVAARRDLHLPRMADAARFAVAALGDDVAEHLAGAATVDHEIALEGSPIAQYIVKIAETGFAGTATELLERVRKAAPMLGDKRLPPDPTRLSGKLREIAHALATVGVVVTFHDRRSSKTPIVIGRLSS